MNFLNKHKTENGEGLRVQQKQQTLSRMYIVMVFLLVGFATVGIKLFFIQVRDRDKAVDKARNQYECKEIIRPKRGLIYDRNRFILASNTYDLCIAADPSVVRRRDTVARYLSKIFEKDASYYLDRLADTTLRYTILERHAPRELEAYFTNWKCSGILIKRESRRAYNFHSIAGQVIGYTNIDNVGRCGIELEFNNELAGKEGFIIYQRDGMGKLRPDVDYPKQEAINGRSIVLTLDQTYQAIAEEELEKGVKKFGARAGSCVILQPRTGELLAMANNPAITLDDRSKYDPSAERNRIITDLFEPGSTFKLVTASAAINEGLFSVEDKIWAENGTYKYSENAKPVKDTHPYGWLTFKEAIEHSSNIAMIKVAHRMGAEKFFTYARKFGFSVPTGVELPGEIPGELKKPSSWNPSTLVYLAFGYQISVNALQMAAAYAAIANDGMLMQPFIKKWLLDSEGNVLEEGVPRMVRRVVTKETAATMKNCLQGVVESGTARLARIDGMSIAGKTGTAQKLMHGTFSKQSYVSSFVGFFPVEDPKILILVILDSPDLVHGYTGGSVAAPIFREIAMKIINATNEFAKKPDPLFAMHNVDETVRVPRVTGMQADVAKKLLQSHGLELNAMGEGDVILAQNPEAGSQTPRGSTVAVSLQKTSSLANTDFVIVPDLIGMTVRQAITFARSLKLQASVIGNGIVLYQYPMPGTRVTVKSSVSISCESKKIYTANLY